MADIQVLLITADGCHFCAHAKGVLARVAERYPLTISEIAWDSDEGRRLVERDGIPFPPGIYLDRRLFGYGRLSSGKLARWMRVRQL